MATGKSVSSNDPSTAAGTEIDVDAIVDAALAVMDEHGLESVSMRKVAAALGVSHIPLYSRVGSKGDLLNAMALRLADGFTLEVADDEQWDDYAARWCHNLREQRQRFGDGQLLVRSLREVMVDASAPLVRLLRDAGVDRDAAVDAVRLLTWSVFGHVTIELGHEAQASAIKVDTEQLFDDHVRYLIDGLRSSLFGGSLT